MTRNDYCIVIMRVSVAELKARLSEFLRAVRSGRAVTVYNRDTPVARIVPVSEGKGTLRVRSPRKGARALRRVELPPPLDLPIDVVDVLREERQGER